MSEAHMTEAERDIVGSSDAAIGYLEARRDRLKWRRVELMTEAATCAAAGIMVLTDGVAPAVLALVVIAIALPLNFVAWGRVTRADDAASAAARDALGLDR